MREKECYLTAAEKEKELAFWEEQKLLEVPKKPGGRGYPDPDMFLYCEQLNALEGVCTLQSCAGHAAADADNKLGYIGVLWIALDERLSRAFFEHGLELAMALDTIEHVALAFKGYGKVQVEIEFDGNERDSLEKSMKAIIEFFQRLVSNA